VKITKNTFVDLAIFMIGFGLFIGVVFPFFMLVLGIPKTYVNTIIFKASCIIAGVIVGAINILLVRVIVGSRIAKISEKMRFIGDKINQAKTIADLSECDDEDCRLPLIHKITLVKVPALTTHFYKL
jgi:two-component system cell cycle response regulator